jgi:hypothetical protein
MMNLTVNRKHKERLFLLVFRERHDLLSLYNAINGTHYTDPQELEFTTIEDAIYMGIKNDISFMVGNVLNLWEHQSSYNPNMPVRGLSYFSRLYQKYTDSHGINIYGSRLKPLPFPQYIVFYNGRKDEPDRMELRLSDPFIRTQAGNEGNSVQEQKEPCLEVKAIMLNINYGKNRELMEQCRKLKEYAQFIERIREYQDSGLTVEEAVGAAVDSCIAQGILADILSKHRAEVIDVFLTDYDEKLRMKVIVNDQVEEKVEEALEEYLTNQIRKKLAKGLSEPEIADMLEIDAAQVEAICKNIREQQEK